MAEPLDEYISLAGEALLCNEGHAWDMYVERIGRDNLRGFYRRLGFERAGTRHCTRFPYARS